MRTTGFKTRELRDAPARIAAIMRYKSVVDNLWEMALNLLFPKRCLGCKRVGSLLCDSCNRELPFLYGQFCPVCNESAVGGFVHEGCKTKYSPDRLISAFLYRKAIRNAVLQLKYRDALIVVRFIGLLLTDYFESFLFFVPKDFDAVSVPLHPNRQRLRAFNQSELIAKELSQQFGLTCRSNLLARVRDTKKQTKVEKKERYSNVKDAFAIPRRVEKEIQGNNFLVVDDVWTTGATAKEVCRVLKKGGANQVWIFTVARG